MSKIHVWIGYTPLSEDEFYQYFEVNRQHVDLGIGGSPFDKEIGINWYDDDLIGTYYRQVAPPLAEVVDEIPVCPTVAQRIIDECAARGISQANAMFYYADAELVIDNTTKLYNGLCYLGCFDR